MYRLDMTQARIQDSEGGGGGSYIQKGGGVLTGISGADPNCCRALGKSTSKKKLQTAVGGGGGSDDPHKKPVSAHVTLAVAEAITPNKPNLHCKIGEKSIHKKRTSQSVSFNRRFSFETSLVKTPGRD